MASLLSGSSPTYLVDFAVSPGQGCLVALLELDRQSSQGRVPGQGGQQSILGQGGLQHVADEMQGTLLSLQLQPLTLDRCLTSRSQSAQRLSFLLSPLPSPPHLHTAAVHTPT